MYDDSMKYKWDNKAVLDYARQEDIQEAREIGKLEGRLEEAIRIIKELKKDGFSIEFIAKVTKRPAAEIEKL